LRDLPITVERSTLGWQPRFDDLQTIVAHALAWERKLSKRAGWQATNPLVGRTFALSPSSRASFAVASHPTRSRRVDDCGL
jgi:hypothetical protein